MKRVTFAFMILCFVLMNQITFASGTKTVLGTWKVTVEDAPDEYVHSNLVVAEVKGELTAKVIFPDSQEVKASEVHFANGTLNFIVKIEGEDIKVVAKVADSKITGEVDTPDGIMDLVAVKK